MASPPIDPVVHLPADDAYLISGRDMVILRNALNYKADAERYRRKAEELELEIVSLRQLLGERDG